MLVQLLLGLLLAAHGAMAAVSTYFQLQSMRDKANVFPIGTQTDKTLQYTTEISNWNFSAQQTTNMGSSGSTGKINFSPLTIKRLVDGSSPGLFVAMAKGTPFYGTLINVKFGSSDSSSKVRWQYSFGTMVISSIQQSLDDESPVETITFDYGALKEIYTGIDAKGQPMNPVIGGWNRISNTDCSNSLEISACIKRR